MRKWWRMRTCTAKAASCPGGRRPTIRRPDHRSQQPQRLARLRGPHRLPFVSPAGARCRAAWRQRGPRGELLSGLGSRRGRAIPTPSRLCPRIRSHSKDHPKRGGADVRSRESGVLSEYLSAPPLPQGLSPRPKLPDSGFLKSPAQKIPLPRRRARAQARHFRPRPRPVGVVALRLCPAGKGLLRRGSSRAGLGAPRSCAAGGFPAPRWAGGPVAVSGGGAGSAPPARFGPGERVPWALRMPLLRLRVRRSPAPGGALSRPRRLVVRKVTVC